MKISKDLIYTFANLMYVGWSPEVIKHKMGISQEVLEAIHQAYFSQSN
jgi:hypothetical protein